MAKTKTEEQRREFLSDIGLNPDAPALDRPEREAGAGAFQWAPPGIDPRTMPVSDIVFTAEMVAQFPDLNPRNRKAAANHLFEIYKAYGRNKDRNSLLNGRIGTFLASVHEERKVAAGGGFVKDKIRLANTLAEHNIDEGDLAEFLAWKAAQG